MASSQTAPLTISTLKTSPSTESSPQQPPHSKQSREPTMSYYFCSEPEIYPIVRKSDPPPTYNGDPSLHLLATTTPKDLTIIPKRSLTTSTKRRSSEYHRILLEAYIAHALLFLFVPTVAQRDNFPHFIFQHHRPLSIEMTPSQDIIPSFQETDYSTAKIEAVVDDEEEDWTIDSHEEAAASDIVNKGVVSFATNAISTLFRGLGDVILTVGVNLVHSEDPFGAVALDYQRRRLSRSFENNFFMEGMWSRWEDDKVPALFNESCKLSYHFKLLESSQSSALVPDKTVSAIMSNGEDILVRESDKGHSSHMGPSNAAEACDEEVGASSILQDLSQDTSADSKFEHHFIRNIDITDGGEVKFLSNELDAVDLASPGLTPTFSADDSDYEEILHDGQNDTTFLEEVLGTLEDNMDLDGFVLV